MQLDTRRSRILWIAFAVACVGGAAVLLTRTTVPTGERSVQQSGLDYKSSHSRDPSASDSAIGQGHEEAAQDQMQRRVAREPTQLLPLYVREHLVSRRDDSPILHSVLEARTRFDDALDVLHNASIDGGLSLPNTTREALERAAAASRDLVAMLSSAENLNAGQAATSGEDDYANRRSILGSSVRAEAANPLTRQLEELARTLDRAASAPSDREALSSARIALEESLRAPAHRGLEGSLVQSDKYKNDLRWRSP